MSQIHHEVTFAAAPSEVYRALMDTEEHARFTGAPAEIGREEGATFSAYGGRVLGRNVELVPGARIIQALRFADWPAGVYSLARFELRGEGDGTRLIFDQDGVPESSVEHLDGGWKTRYWEPLRRHLER